MPEQSSWVVETTTADTFEADALVPSTQQPVVVDFWAPWCSPCRELTPKLEALVREYRGKFLLVKVNVDEAPEIAQAFGVQSIPHVVAISDGKPVNQFSGLLPEDQLRAWLADILPSPVDELISRGQALEAEDPATAEASYREAGRLAPDNDAVRIHLARVLLAQNRNEECRQIVTDLESRGYLEPEAERIKSQLDLRSSAEEAGGIDEARAAVQASPDDLTLQLKLADALAVAQQYEEALEICLTLIQRDKAGIGVEAKSTMLKIFDLMGPDSDLVSAYRRKLATMLY